MKSSRGNRQSKKEGQKNWEMEKSVTKAQEQEVKQKENLDIWGTGNQVECCHAAERLNE